jgi:hypothetical protein
MVGWGSGVWSLAQYAGRLEQDLPGFGARGMLGLSTVASIATLTNFFVPIGLSFSVTMLGAGMLMLVYYGWAKHRLKPLAPIAIVVSVFGLIAITTPAGYDAGLYHLPHEYWIRTEKVVFGLANLHGRFGFNSMLEPLLASAWLPGPDLGVAQLLTILFSVFFLLELLEVGADSATPSFVSYFCSNRSTLDGSRNYFERMFCVPSRCNLYRLTFLVRQSEGNFRCTMDHGLGKNPQYRTYSSKRLGLAA